MRKTTFVVHKTVYLDRRPSLTKEVWTSFKEDVLTAGLPEATDRMFDVNPDRKTTVWAA